jgi:hypothetical protein
MMGWTCAGQDPFPALRFAFLVLLSSSPLYLSVILSNSCFLRFELSGVTFTHFLSPTVPLHFNLKLSCEC